jgi:hypothetical protein
MEEVAVGLRREAVRRRLAGESPEVIARELGRTRQWVRKWSARYDPDDPGWAQGRSHTARPVANRTDAQIELQVLAVRAKLEANPWAQVGAAAITWELDKLGAAVPPLSTIERILRRAGTTGRKRAGRRASKAIAYPAPVAQRSGEVVQVDLVGPRHLDGGVGFHALNQIDVASHHAEIEIVPDRADERVIGALHALWSRHGVPGRVQFDNGGPFVSPTGVGDVVRGGHNMARVLRPGGVALHLLPARYALFAIAARMLPFKPLIGLLHRVMPWTIDQVEFDVFYDHGHPVTMDRVFRRAGFQHVEIEVVWGSRATSSGAIHCSCCTVLREALPDAGRPPPRVLHARARHALASGSLRSSAEERVDPVGDKRNNEADFPESVGSGPRGEVGELPGERLWLEQRDECDIDPRGECVDRDRTERNDRDTPHQIELGRRRPHRRRTRVGRCITARDGRPVPD